eukprot:3493111-Pleurochrysis_carterae.AAC.1
MAATHCAKYVCVCDRCSSPYCPSRRRHIRRRPNDAEVSTQPSLVSEDDAFQAVPVAAQVDACDDCDSDDEDA